MKRMQIRTKITLWYTSFMVILMVILLAVLVYFSDVVLNSKQKERLIHSVQEALENIREGDEYDFVEDGVYLLQYNANREYDFGTVPKGFDIQQPLQEKKVKQQSQKGLSFYSYDEKGINEKKQVVWIRGVISNSEVQRFYTIFLSISFILIPLLVLSSSMIGYWITKKAFLPVQKIQETAEMIANQKDLSARIGLPPGKDEISKLGATMDGMLEKLEENFEREKQFTADASHELRTPVSVILSESEFTLQYVDSIEEAKESMEVIHRQAGKMSKLIQELLFYARAENGRISLAYEGVQIRPLLEELIEEKKERANEKSIEITLSCKEEVEAVVDCMLFSRAVSNLIDNAISYGKKSGYIVVAAYVEQEEFIIRVEDNGIGIKEENLSKVWNRFYQVEESRNHGTSTSLGLGLSMVRWIVEEHGGRVKVTSKLGEGSCFYLYFPIKNKLF